MGADIIQMAAHRKKEKPSLKDLLDRAIEDISGDWERFARNNRLNDFVTSSIGVWAQEGTSYTSDLNALALIEGRLGMNVMIRSPYGPAVGWRASFMLKSATATTPDMPFETYARCFNILLFIRLKRDLVLHDLTDEL